MAKLYFRYGTMNSAKTLNLLAVAHNYRSQGKVVKLVKPELDERWGRDQIRSRAGLGMAADFVVSGSNLIDEEQLEGTHCILVDEAQFLSVIIIEQLRLITLDLDIPVICYGLRSDFRGELFHGSRRLFELADSIEEIKTTCAFCNRKAIMNLKHVNGVATIDGPSIELGAEEKYLPACYTCYRREILAAEGLRQAANC